MSGSIDAQHKLYHEQLFHFSFKFVAIQYVSFSEYTTIFRKCSYIYFTINIYGDV